jgi:hypothetical protein
VYLANDVRPRQDQQVVVALQVFGVLAESLAAEILLREAAALNNNTQRAVADEDAAIDERCQL